MKKIIVKTVNGGWNLAEDEYMEFSTQEGTISLYQLHFVCGGAGVSYQVSHIQ